MDIDIRFRGLRGSPSLRQRVLRCIQFQLARFAADLTSVRVRVEDTNGPKGGLDKRCQFDVRGPRFGFAIVEQHSNDAWSAVDGAAHRTGRTIARLLARG